MSGTSVLIDIHGSLLTCNEVAGSRIGPSIANFNTEALASSDSVSRANLRNGEVVDECEIAHLGGFNETAVRLGSSEEEA